jgi:prepilin-type N-terminal cleavage/methylation domain-containing protein
MKDPNRPSGFTLMELMIGLVIVGILATMAIPGFSRAVEKTRVKDAQVVLAGIYSSEKVYRLDQGSYGTLNQLVANRYIANPNAGNTAWAFDAGGGTKGIATTFAAGAERLEGGYAGIEKGLIAVDQNFSGGPNDNPGYGGRTYLGNHELRD